jgi:Icc protein
MRIVQISDSHISRNHPARATELKACVQHINALDPQPDVVVHTGDISHDGFAEEYAVARQILDDLAAPYLVLAGNRDKRQELIRAFSDGDHIRLDMEFVQYSVERFEVRLIIVDTVSGTSNKGRLCQTRLAHIERMLLQDTSRPAVLFLHHPPFEVSVAPDPFQYETWEEVKALEGLIAQHSQIRGVFCGHVHQNIESAIGAVRATTVTCIATDLRKGKAVLPAVDLPMIKTYCF